MDLTSTEITSYLLRNAFASVRSGDASSTSRSNLLNVVETGTVEETMKLLSGSSERMATISANLEEMLAIAKSAIGTSVTEAEKQEAYAKLRSLGAGIDTIVSKTTFNDELLLNGTQLDLTCAGSFSRMVMSDLTTTGKNGLGLATSEAGAEMVVSYDDFCTWNNEMVGIEGLDISAVRYTGEGIASKELKTGQYVVEVVYAGANSTIIINDKVGNEVSRAENVDLSGSGMETVKFGVGIEMDIAKSDDSDNGIDKYDFETEGSPSLFANLDYARVTTYDLAGSAETTASSASLGVTSNKVKDADGGTIQIEGVGLGQVSSKSKELETGQYRVEVYTDGMSLSAVLYNSKGTVVGNASSVTLAEDGIINLDFGNGLVLDVENKGFSGSAQMKAVVNYEQAVNAYDDFDFEAYLEKIEEAIELVDEQTDIVDKAYDTVETAYNAINGSASTNTSTSQLLTNLLGGGTSRTAAYSLLFGSSSTSLSWTSSMITSNLETALGLQSNAGTSLISLLADNVDSLDPTSLASTNNTSRI
jgi:hypothetical protein